MIDHLEDSKLPVKEQIEVPLRRSQRERRYALSDDYIVYLNEFDNNIGQVNDRVSFDEAIYQVNKINGSLQCKKKLKSMQHNEILELIDLSKEFKPFGCKWIFNTKKDSEEKIDRYESMLVAKEFRQREGIAYTKTFSPTFKGFF